MEQETKAALGTIRQSLGEFDREPDVSWRRKIAVLIVAPPLSVVVAVGFGVRHYLLRTMGVLRQSGGD